MHIIGIVSEYNPFHKGHMHHIAESRRRFGGDAAVVAVMSGCFVQRGEAACMSKFARAKAACLSGCDLVLELPLPWAVSSAETFARGAVGLLGSLGVVTDLSFGSESADLERMHLLAETLLDPAVVPRIRHYLEQGLPYAAARQAALTELLGDTAKMLESPNDILGVEYVKAIYDMRLSISPMAVQRVGAGHDKRGGGEFRSASELRSILAAGGDVSRLVPAPAWEIYARELRDGRAPVRMEALETAILSRLRMLPQEAYDLLPDAGGEGLANRLRAAAVTEPSLEGILAVAKTKRYAMSRLRRMLMCAALGVTADMSAGLPPYARVLAATGKGCELLRSISRMSPLPVITKPATARKLPREAARIFELEAAATDLFVLGYAAKEERRAGADWRTSPAILE